MLAAERRGKREKREEGESPSRIFEAPLEGGREGGGKGGKKDILAFSLLWPFAAD